MASAIRFRRAACDAARHGLYGRHGEGERRRPGPNTLPPGKLDDGFDSMKTGESIRPIVLY
ncbi:hypothetical protein [Burkholderia ambifaria]|uniref:hypothetical protein n=1 Tax=Burkholderia ambifaria TaxID=152480 RepID=UPI0002F6CE2B|nr:hypothetical protein [Burkholderia ambifaria]